MAISNPFSITYNGLTVGGSVDTYQLLGPYVIDKTFESIRLVFDVIVVAASYSGLQSSSESLEDAFRARLRSGDELEISINGNAWTYVHGASILNTEAQIAKSGNPETDRGYSRAYTVTITGELPADGEGDNGLREIEVLVDYDPARRKVVSMRGIYTASSAGTAKQEYESDGDSVASDYLDAIDSAATFELVDETFTMDRQRQSDGDPDTHILQWSRTYQQIIANQVQGTLDDPQIKDHRITFTDIGQYPGDSQNAFVGTSASGDSTDRLRRVLAQYDCAVDIDETTNLTTVYKNKIKDHVRALFISNFDPARYAIEEERVGYDTTSNRISVSYQFLYQRPGGEPLLELSQSVAYREARTIDYTPQHEDDEYAFDADVGFASLERVWTRTAIALGDEAPKTRILERAKGGGPVGKFDGSIADLEAPDRRDTAKVEAEGWNVITSGSQVDRRYIGDPEGAERIAVSVLTETIVERFHRKPGNRTSNPITG